MTVSQPVVEISGIALTQERTRNDGGQDKKSRLRATPRTNSTEFGKATSRDAADSHNLTVRVAQTNHKQRLAALTAVRLKACTGSNALQGIRSYGNAECGLAAAVYCSWPVWVVENAAAAWRGGWFGGN
ncbi:unnamed protein product [Zymoseptoria tritici ST99CH_1A5]|uniref:Uncharacterized protein n=2 Tax=Zymoseptoria tritici TaxID=1047171 RepID=A0A1X7S3L3_ZYMT9|nr:unnamed protein product [Zymoseptoria tritici ST99CH_3D7]SMR61660.1 unnamed protein product [Zymoseptoria tritici ST99CH_3D1]SMY27873.1 unnamed protein product [Zymoseptoria tritici ST99CH_1A5]